MAKQFAGRESCRRPGAVEMDSECVCKGACSRSVLRRVPCSFAPMSAPVENILARVHPPRVENGTVTQPQSVPAIPRLRARTLMAVPTAALIAIAGHWGGGRDA